MPGHVSPSLFPSDPTLGQDHSDLHIWERPGEGESPPLPGNRQLVAPQGSRFIHSPVLNSLHRGLDSEELAPLPQAISQGGVVQTQPQGWSCLSRNHMASVQSAEGGVESASVVQGTLEPSLCRCPLTLDPTPVTSLFQVLIKTKGHVGAPERDTEE